MSEAITIKRLGPDDLQMLMSVPEGLFDNPVSPEQAQAFLDSRLNILFLAFEAGNAVGMASGTVLLHPDKPPALLINEVGVRESRRRRGIGKALTRALIDCGRKTGCHGIWLGTETYNLAARSLYRSLGGEEFVGVFYGWDDAI